MQVVGYISSSRNHEIDREIELKIQRERIEDFCRKESLELLAIYEEAQDSREDYKPELFKILNLASDKKFSKVIVLKLETLAKDKVAKIWVMNELKKHGVSIHSLTEDLMPVSLMDKEESIKKANRIKSKVRDLPSLPEVVNKVMELVQDPNSSAAQLSKVISHDAGLTSRVLKLVNSAYYGFPKQISSIQHAIMILGFTTMRGLVLSSSIFKIFAPRGDNADMLDYKELWKHTLLSAIAAKHINKYMGLNQDEHIFSAAILHDIGKIILDQYDHANYIQVSGEVSDQLDFVSLIKAEENYCGISHSDMGYLLAEQWNLPMNISESIRCHHNPIDAKEEYKEIVGIICLGNTLAHLIGKGKTISMEDLNADILDIIEVDESDITEITMLINEEIEEIGNLESFFS